MRSMQCGGVFAEPGRDCMRCVWRRHFPTESRQQHMCVVRGRLCAIEYWFVRNMNFICACLRLHLNSVRHTLHVQPLLSAQLESTSNAFLGESACLFCTSGTYSNVTGSKECVPCDAGRRSAPGATVCTTCGVGTYSATGSATACGLCARGTFQNRTGSTTCVSFFCVVCLLLRGLLCRMNLAIMFCF